MENILHRNKGFFLFRSSFERIAIFFVVRLSRWLSHTAPKKWKNEVLSQPVFRPYGIGDSRIVEPGPKYAIHPESLTGKGSSVDALREKNIPIVLPDWAKEIHPFLANQLSDHTRRAYETDLKQFFSFLEGRILPSQFHSLKSEHIILFRKALEEGRLTGKVMGKSTINRKLAVVKSYLNWLRAQRIIAENPAQWVKGFPQSQESSLKGLSDEEVRKILEKPNRNSKAGSLHGAVLATLLYLGLRKGELISLKVGDLDEERGTPVMKVRGKGHRIRILPITEHVRLAIEHYLRVCKRDKTDKEAPLFTPTKNPRNGQLFKTLNPNAITYMVSHYARKVGILKPISPHSCRATCISNALDRKATHRSVQHLAGWSTPLMIQRYDKRREDLKNSAAFLINYAEDAAQPQNSNAK